jgi:hypothetical protein
VAEEIEAHFQGIVLLIPSSKEVQQWAAKEVQQWAAKIVRELGKKGWQPKHTKTQEAVSAHKEPGNDQAPIANTLLYNNHLPFGTRESLSHPSSWPTRQSSVLPLYSFWN